MNDEQRAFLKECVTAHQANGDPPAYFPPRGALSGFGARLYPRWYGDGISSSPLVDIFPELSIEANAWVRDTEAEEAAAAIAHFGHDPGAHADDEPPAPTTEDTSTRRKRR